MFLLGSDTFRDLASRDRSRKVFIWLTATHPGQSQLFASAISVGVVAYSVEQLPSTDRDHWRRLLSQARRQFENEGGILDVNAQDALEWARLREFDLRHDNGDEVGDDDLLVIAAAISRDLTLVTVREAYHEQIVQGTALSLLEP
jgi:predicted nucleic acid-binding protein